MVLLYTTYQTISSVQILKKPLKFVDVTINHDQRLSLTRTALKPLLVEHYLHFIYG